MSDRPWEFELFEPGMTAFHRAGLVGMLASMRSPRWASSVSPNVDGSRLTLHGLGESKDELHQFLQQLYALEDGLIDFPVLGRLLRRTRADIQSILLQTFLQHPSSRKVEKDTKSEGEDEEQQFTYKPIVDFNHRSLKTADDIVKARKKGSFVSVAGWALPGAVAKHIAHASTKWEDSSERYLLLMCAPLGCLYFKAQSYDVNGDWDDRTQSIVVLPQGTDLSQQSDRLMEYYEDRSQETSITVVGGVSDASLQSAIAMGLHGEARDQSGQFYAMRFGGVVWSRQQKTRTGTATVGLVSDSLRHEYQSILAVFGNHERTSAKGAEYSLVMPMRDRMAQNLLRGDPWYLGFSEYVGDQRGWFMKDRDWREGMSELVANRKKWDSELRSGFVDVMQKAVNNRFGQVYSQAVSGGNDTRRAFTREYERMILSFEHCRTREALRETLMRFVADTYPRLRGEQTTQLTEREILQRCVFEAEVEWRELRDLCLLAIATYRGQHAVRLSEVLADSEDKFDDESIVEENV